MSVSVVGSTSYLMDCFARWIGACALNIVECQKAPKDKSGSPDVMTLGTDTVYIVFEADEVAWVFQWAVGNDGSGAT